MNFKDKYREDFDKLKLDDRVLDELKQSVCYENRRELKRLAVSKGIYACVAVLVLGLIFSKRLDFNWFQTTNDEEVGVSYDKAEDDWLEAGEPSRLSTLVVDGQVYYEGSSQLSVDEASALKGALLGVTKSLASYVQNEGTSSGVVDLSSLSGLIGIEAGLEVYRVNGYEASVRLLTYNEKAVGNKFQLWESFDGVEIQNFGSVLEALNINGQIKEMSWDTYENWNEAAPSPKVIMMDSTVTAFLQLLNDATPIKLTEALREQFYSVDETQAVNQKFIYLELMDGTDLTLRLSKGGYVSLSPGFSLDYIFQIDETAVQSVWELLK